MQQDLTSDCILLRVVESLKDLKRNGIQGVVVGTFQNDERSCVSIESFGPAQYAQAPLIPRFQSGKSPFRSGRAQVVATNGAEFKECFGHHCTYDMGATIIGVRLAAAIPEEAGQ